MLDFSSDYNVGAHPCVIKRLVETNEGTSGTYGFDEYSESARKKYARRAANPRHAYTFSRAARRLTRRCLPLF